MALVDFRYVRTGTGELSGPSMIHQTEQAFNELGTEIEDIRTDSGDALETAKDALEKAETATSAAASAQQTATEAVATANAAQATATEAVASANAAQETAQAANATAEQASTEAAAAKATAENALEKATGAEETSGNALSAAQSAQETASDALGTASTAQASADAAKKAAATAQTTADSAQSTAGQAFNLATALSSSRYFLEDSDTVDLDGLSSITRLYLTGSVSITLADGTKINAPFWFWNEFSTDGTHGLQYVCAEGKLCLREGTVSGGKMTWGSWKYVVPAATGAALGTVKPDGITTSVDGEGVISINTALLSQVYKFKGSVSTKDDLPTDAAQGDVYNVEDTGVNYGWTGTAWDALGGIETVDPAPVQGSANPVSSGGVYTALNRQKTDLEAEIEAKAPTSHASTSTVYGIGTGTGYGHVKLSDSTGSTSAASSGVAATPKALKAAYDLAGKAKKAAATAQAAAEAALSAVKSISIPGAVVPFYNVNLGGEANRNPIFWGQSEPDTGWLICDGGSDGRGGSVPDLRNRFVMCSSYSGDAGQTGGATSVTPTVSVQNATQGGSIGNTTATGNVDVSGTNVGVQGTTLSVAQLASHSHRNSLKYVNANTSGATSSAFSNSGNPSYYNTDETGGNQWHDHGVYDPGHTHSFSGTAHTHTFTGAVHTHVATADPINTLPPYYKMAYCVKLPG